MRFELGSYNRQNNLLKKCPQYEVLIVTLEQCTYFFKKSQNFTVYTCLNQSQEYIAHMSLVKLLEKIFTNVDEVFDVLDAKSKPIKEQIQTVVSSLIIAQ